MIVLGPPVQTGVAGKKPEASFTLRKFVLPLLLACGFLIFVSSSSIYLVVSSQSSRELMNRALQLENKLWGILAAVRVAESEQRGYLLTGDPGYLETFRTTADSELNAITAFREIILDGSAQQLVLVAIEPLVARKFSELRETIRLQDAGEREAAMARVATGEGLELTTKIRGEALRLMETQRDVIAKLRSSSTSANIWLLLVNLFGFALIIALAMISVLLMRRAAGKELAWSESRGDELRATMDQRGKSEQKFKDMLEAASDAIVIMDRSGDIVLVNARTEILFGHARADLLGQKIEFLLPPRYHARHPGHRDRFFAAPKARPMGVGLELYGQHKDGTEFPIEISLSPLNTEDGMLVSTSICDISVRKEAEKNLGRMEARYRGLLEAAPDAMVVVNQGGEIILLNLQAEKEFGYRRDELLGQKVTNIIPDGFAERLLADGRRSPADAVAQQIGTGIELIGKRKDGAEFPIEIMLSPLESTEGILVTAAIRDISVRKEAERDLARMEARYRGLLEAAPDAMVVVDQGGEIVLLNLQAEKEFGYRRDELLGQKVTNIIPDGFAERLLADGRRSPADAVAQQIGTGIELIGKRKDGSEFPIEIMLSPLESTGVILVTAAIRDISVRKGAEKHLAQMEAKYRGLLEAAPDAIVVVNQGGEIILLNLQAEKEFGYRRDELLGQKVTNIIPDGFAERLLADGRRSPADAVAQQIGTGIELIGKRKDGAEFPIEIMLSPLESTGVILVTAAIRDISVRKGAEKHLAQMEAKYRGLLEAAPDAMVVVNQGGEIILLNLQAEKEFGYRRDELLGQKVTNIIPDGFAERLLADGRRSPADALAQQIGTGIELIGKRKDGAEFPIEIMLSPLESTEGSLVTAAIRDISVRKGAEKHLAQMEAKYRGLLEAAPDAMVVVNQGGEIILLNLQAEKEFGYRRDELLGQKVTNIIPDGFAERLLADGLRSPADALAQQIGTGIELIGKRKDGAEFPIEIMLSPLESTEGSLVTAAIRDISVRKGAEKHLAQMEAKYRGLLEAAPDAMVVVNQGGEIILLNLQAEKEFGYRRDELLGQKVTNIIPDGFAERLLADGLRSPADALAQQIGTGIELIGKRKDGAEFPIEIMLSPLESTEGSLVTAAIRDISVRKDAERHLAQMEARSRGLLEAAPEAMLVVDQGGEIVLLNLQAEKEFGYRRDELLGQKLTSIIPEGFAERLLTDGVDVLARQIVAGIDLTGRRKDENEFPIEIMLSPLESGEGMLVIRDISLRKDAEKHLALMEARYHGLLEAAPDTMVVVNHAGEIVLLNLQAEKEFGYRRDELLGQNIKKIIPERVAERLIANGLRSSLTLQIGAETELTGRRKDGGEFPIEIMLSPLESAERILVIRDISVRRQTERLKDEFVATVSHELRTPLTSISGSLGLLAGQWASKLPESAARLLAIAHTNSQRLARLLNDILDIEKLESGHVVFNLNKVAVRPLVEHAIEENRGYAESYGVFVRLDAASADLDVNADPDRLAQVITNLLSNAIKFSPAGGEVLVAVEKNANGVRVTVRDHGFGVPDDFKLRIFEKFAQADATNSRQKGGTGLGLSIVKQIVERLGGKVGFDDAPGGGAVFYVELPAWDGKAGGEIDPYSDAADTRILFCEDDRAAAIVVREQLRQSGFAVDFAHTVAAALARTDATRYAAILIDLQLPDGDGVSLIVRLRAQVHYRDVPIIVIAGDPDQGRSDVRSARLNVLRWISKPIDFEPLTHILKAALAPPLRQRPRILHVDDDSDVLALVAHELRVVADVVSAESVESARRTLATDRIDLAVLDIGLGEESGLDLLPDLRGRFGGVIPVIIFSNHGAGVPCDDQVHVALSKMNSSLESLGAAVRDRLALLPA